MKLADLYKKLLFNILKITINRLCRFFKDSVTKTLHWISLSGISRTITFFLLFFVRNFKIFYFMDYFLKCWKILKNFAGIKKIL